MTNAETRRLLGYVYAKQNRFIPARPITSKRQAKNAGRHVGVTNLSNGRIISEVGLETIFNHPSRKY